MEIWFLIGLFTQASPCYIWVIQFEIFSCFIKYKLWCLMGNTCIKSINGLSFITSYHGYFILNGPSHYICKHWQINMFWILVIVNKSKLLFTHVIFRIPRFCILPMVPKYMFPIPLKKSSSFSARLTFEEIVSYFLYQMLKMEMILFIITKQFFFVFNCYQIIYNF